MPSRKLQGAQAGNRSQRLVDEPDSRPERATNSGGRGTWRSGRMGRERMETPLSVARCSKGAAVFGGRLSTDRERREPRFGDRGLERQGACPARAIASRAVAGRRVVEERRSGRDRTVRGRQQAPFVWCASGTDARASACPSRATPCTRSSRRWPLVQRMLAGWPSVSRGNVRSSCGTSLPNAR